MERVCNRGAYHACAVAKRGLLVGIGTSSPAGLLHVKGLEAEFRIVLPSGQTRWLRSRGRVLTDDTGSAVRFLGAGFDTTRQQGEQARVARVLESMNAAFFALDPDWRFEYVNGEAERLLLHSREELLGGSIWELFPAALDSDFETHYRGAAATGEERVFEAYYPAPLDAWFQRPPEPRAAEEEAWQLLDTSTF